MAKKNLPFPFLFSLFLLNSCATSPSPRKLPHQFQQRKEEEMASQEKLSQRRRPKSKRKKREKDKNLNRPLTKEQQQRKRILDYYQSLRKLQKKRSPPSKKRKGKKMLPAPYFYRTYQRAMVERRQRRKRPLPPLSDEKVKELNIEISQNLLYFCMKRRKQPRFSDPKKCENFTQNIFEQCKEKYPIYRDRSPLYCVKSKLH